MRRRIGRKQPRQGATLVLVALLIVLIGGMAAFAIDLARIYSGVNEMQTGADAAALAGALRLQRNPGSSPVTQVQAFAASNSASGSPISIAAGDVAGGIWNPATSVFTATANWSLATAVRVTARTNATLAFGALMSRSSLAATRSSVAWIANQSAKECVKPWGFPVAYMNTLISPYTFNSQAGVNALRTLTSTPNGQYAATIIAAPPAPGVRGNTPTTTFIPFTNASNHSNQAYQTALTGVYCSDGTADYIVGTTENTQPGNGYGDIPKKTADNIDAFCRTGNVATDAACYNPSGPAGVEGITVTVIAATVNGSNTAAVNALVGFRLMCVFRGSDPGRSVATESCPYLTRASPYDGGKPANDYMQGTLVGYPIFSMATSGGVNTLGSVISPAQRLVIVK